ncbi:alpha-E domain-containing protein [Jannaschia sp. W003]|uniref:alpha-E domain-containing protein n=1 Tax=Jannaschia sp. W003 TaxID=2867012 RepID=UPI0021A53FE0|nr:alpha-E domain-containing protein [Jannaschia sp. W003]UWQ22461.1 alpha-E domain-containing protein [Jannaschia sp. W003]
MLGKTAGGLLWMFRYLERAENLARLVETGQRIALTRPDTDDASEWASVLESASARAGYDAHHDAVTGEGVSDWLLRHKENPSSVMACLDQARSNAKLVRTALTREVWEGVNEAWMTACTALQRRVPPRDLPRVVGAIRNRSAFVRGTLHGTMLRNDSYDFARLGTFLERADATARLLDVKYYVLLPSAAGVGSRLDNAQWEVILRGVSAENAFRIVHGQARGPEQIAHFLILDGRMPRSLAFCYSKVRNNLDWLHKAYGGEKPECLEMAETMRAKLGACTSIDPIFEEGLHEFLQDFRARNNALSRQVETDYRFYA